MISNYIQELVKKGELTSWSVVVMNKNQPAVQYTFSSSIQAAVLTVTAPKIQIGTLTTFVKITLLEIKPMNLLIWTKI